MKVTYFFDFAPAGDGKIANLFIQCGVALASIIVGGKKNLVKSREKNYNRPLPSAKRLKVRVLSTHMFRIADPDQEKHFVKLQVKVMQSNFL
jgi:hypothetical protein